MHELLQMFKWAVLINTVFMTLWMGYRITVRDPVSWVLFDAAIIVLSLAVLDQYRARGL